jgi:hypothetical protein
MTEWALKKMTPYPNCKEKFRKTWPETWILRRSTAQSTRCLWKSKDVTYITRRLRRTTPQDSSSWSDFSKFLLTIWVGRHFFQSLYESFILQSDNIFEIKSGSRNLLRPKNRFFGRSKFDRLSELLPFKINSQFGGTEMYDPFNTPHGQGNQQLGLQTGTTARPVPMLTLHTPLCS